jgi:hypothetical protein
MSIDHHSAYTVTANTLTPYSTPSYHADMTAAAAQNELMMAREMSMREHLDDLHAAHAMSHMQLNTPMPHTASQSLPW